MKDTLIGLLIGATLVLNMMTFFSDTIKEKQVEEFVKHPNRYQIKYDSIKQDTIVIYLN